MKPHGAFLSDSVKIGLPVQYTLSLRHPPDIQVVFPDSGYRFGPFEWVGKRYFPTRTDARGSMDSVVYTFTTFNIDSVQRLRLPVFIARQRDCTAVYTDTDSLLVRQLISRSPKFMVPRTNIDYVPVLQTLDYQLILLIAGVSVLFVLLLYALFGRRIKRQYRLYRLWRGHRSFVSNYEKLRRRVRTQKEPVAVENTVILWKRYMEGLHEKPYTSYTTKEITEVIDQPNLADSLQTADRAIYGNTMPDEIYGALRNLQAIAEHFYKRRRTEVRSG
ncbi:MAG: hypothetical protein MUD08_05730 [Cytophagales bacterium]|nr:hypothetical protein [Cytophagales bacterium]